MIALQSAASRNVTFLDGFLLPPGIKKLPPLGHSLWIWEPASQQASTPARSLGFPINLAFRCRRPSISSFRVSPDGPWVSPGGLWLPPVCLWMPPGYIWLLPGIPKWTPKLPKANTKTPKVILKLLKASLKVPKVSPKPLKVSP